MFNGQWPAASTAESSATTDSGLIWRLLHGHRPGLMLGVMLCWALTCLVVLPPHSREAAGIQADSVNELKQNTWNGDAVCRDFLKQTSEAPPNGLSISGCVHLLRLHGLDAEVRVAGEYRRVLELLTNAKSGKEIFGFPPFLVQQSGGVRFPTMVNDGTVSGPFDQAHRDLCLACFAELGLPIDYRLVGEKGETFELRAALRDSVSNFRLSQRELEWTTVAYARFVTGTSWCNRFGETTTFDALARELMKRPLHRSSCGGVHRLKALTMLVAGPAGRRLSGDVAEDVTAYLSESVQFLSRTQSLRGYWTEDWCQVADAARSSPAEARLDTGYSRILVTGHLLEWFRELPPEIRVPPKMIARSRDWLREQLMDGNHSYWENFCPFTHVLCGLAD